MAQKCPSCQSPEFFYVQAVREYHTIAAMPEKNEHGQCGYVELVALDDTQTIESFDPYLKCNGCGVRLNLDGTPNNA